MLRQQTQHRTKEMAVDLLVNCLLVIGCVAAVIAVLSAIWPSSDDDPHDEGGGSAYR